MSRTDLRTRNRCFTSWVSPPSPDAFRWARRCGGSAQFPSARGFSLVSARGPSLPSSTSGARGFEPRTSCMPSARDPFMRVQISPNRHRLLGFRFISVHQNSLQFKSTAEVDAKANPLRAVQGVTLNWRRSSEFTTTTEKLLKYRSIQFDMLNVQGVDASGFKSACQPNR